MSHATVHQSWHITSNRSWKQSEGKQEQDPLIPFNSFSFRNSEAGAISLFLTALIGMSFTDCFPLEHM